MNKFQELIKEKSASIEQLDEEIEKKEEIYNEEYSELQSTKEAKQKLVEEIQDKNSQKEELEFYENKNILIHSFKTYLKVTINAFKKDYQEKKIVSAMMSLTCLTLLFGSSFSLSKTYGIIGLVIIPSVLALMICVIPTIVLYIDIKKTQKKNNIVSLEAEIEKLTKELEILRTKEEKSNTKINDLKIEISALNREKTQTLNQIEYIQSMLEQALRSVDTQTILNQEFDSMNVEEELKLILEKKEGDK